MHKISLKLNIQIIVVKLFCCLCALLLIIIVVSMVGTNIAVQFDQRILISWQTYTDVHDSSCIHNNVAFHQLEHQDPSLLSQYKVVRSNCSLQFTTAYLQSTIIPNIL